MSTTALPRPAARLVIAGLLALLSACNPCDYFDTSNYKGSGFSKEVYEQMERDRPAAEAAMRPEVRAAREELRRRIAADTAQLQASQEAKVLRDKARLEQCVNRYSVNAAAWLIGLLFLGIVAHGVSKLLTGRSLHSWLTGKRR